MSGKTPAWLADAIGAAGDLVYELELATDRLRFFGPAEAVLGPGPTPASGEAFSARVNPEDLPLRIRALAEHMGGNGRFDCEYRLRDASARVHWVHERGACLRDGEGRPIRLGGVLRAITERKLGEARRAQAEGYDPLTGHMSRARLIESLEFAIAHAKRHGAPGGLLAIGIDGLAAVEDARGHDGVDRLIIEAGRCLDSCLRTTDAIGRLGAETFGVLLTPCLAEQIVPTAAKILARLAGELGSAPGGPESHVGGSIGAVGFPAHARSADEALARAEAALAAARLDGGRTPVVYAPTAAERAEERQSLAVAERLNRALRDGGLVFAYQPIVRADTLEPAYYECLLRLADSAGGPAGAPGSIAAAERLGDIPAVDRKTLEMAIDTLERHRAIGLSVNLSGLTVSNRAWLRALTQRLRMQPELARRLVVEITETAAMRDIEESGRFIAQVRELGVRVALDDFGAGFTSFRHLKALAVDVVKIDSAFCAGVAENADSQLFIRSLRAVAQGLGLASVAEGVATEADEAFLRGEGVQYFQGHRYGAPTIAPQWAA